MACLSMETLRGWVMMTEYQSGKNYKMRQSDWRENHHQALRPALTPWILLKISSQWRSTSEKSRRCCQCTCIREESPPLPSLDQRNNLKKLNLHHCVYLFIILCILVSNSKCGENQDHWFDI